MSDQRIDPAAVDAAKRYVSDLKRAVHAHMVAYDLPLLRQWQSDHPPIPGGHRARVVVAVLGQEFS